MLLGDKCPQGLTYVQQQRHMPSGKNKLERDFQISKHHYIETSIILFLIVLDKYNHNKVHQVRKIELVKTRCFGPKNGNAVIVDINNVNII